MEENKNTNQFFKGALCGALAMFLAVGMFAGAIFLLRGTSARDEDLAAKTEAKLEDMKSLIDALYLYSDEWKMKIWKMEFTKGM